MGYHHLGYNAKLNLKKNKNHCAKNSTIFLY